VVSFGTVVLLCITLVKCQGINDNVKVANSCRAMPSFAQNDKLVLTVYLRDQAIHASIIHLLFFWYRVNQNTDILFYLLCCARWG
jgi:hypothetical protein